MWLRTLLVDPAEQYAQGVRRDAGSESLEIDGVVAKAGYAPVEDWDGEVEAVLNQMAGRHRLIAALLYGTGLRLSECLRLRIKDLDFDYRQITVREGKGGKEAFEKTIVPIREFMGGQIEQTHNQEAVWMGFSTGLRPSYWQSWHSDNAHKPRTNNVTNTDDPELDRLIEAYRNSLEAQERIELSQKIQKIIHDIGAFVPTSTAPYVRQAYWRWWRLPVPPGTQHSEDLFDP